MKNYYDILEVNRNTSKEVIEKAYKVLVKRYHPDLYKGQQKQIQEQKIKEINEAYKVLSNEFLREQYDKELDKEKWKKEQAKARNYQNQENQARTRARQAANTQKNNINKQQNEQIQDYQIGTLGGLIALSKQIFKNLKQSKANIKNVTKKDLLAIFLTIIIIVLLGIILWFIPFTNGWIRELIFENPLFQAIGKLFSK